MENVKCAYARKMARIVIIVLCACAMALMIGSACFARDVVAYADNIDDIGSAGGDISVADVTEYPTVNSEKILYIGATKGVTLLVRVPTAATKVYIGFQIDSNDVDSYSWVIGANDYPLDNAVPYMQVLGEGHNDYETYPDISYRAEWTAPVINNGKREFTVTLHANGEFWASGIIDEDDEPLECLYYVKSVDWNPPTLEDVYSYKASGNKNDGSYVLSCRAVFSDNLRPALASAISGIGYLAIIRTDAKPDDSEEVESTAGYEIVAEYYRNNKGETVIPNSVLTSYTLDFDIDKDGYYYYYVEDRVLNSEVGRYSPVFGEDKVCIEVDGRFSVTTTINGSVETLNVENQMRDYGAYIENNKEKVNKTLYNDISQEYATLMLAFMSGNEEVSNMYWSFVRGNYQSFKSDVDNGAAYTVEVVNDDFFIGKITAINLNATTLSALGGDKVKAEINITVVPLDKADADIVTAADLNEVTNIYRLSYKLSVNGLVDRAPLEAIIYNVALSVPDSLREVALVVKTPSGYATKKVELGISFLRFDSSLNEAEYYLVTNEERSEASDLMPLWITLGVVGGLAIVACVVIFILYKKKILPVRKSGAEKLASPEPVDPSVPKPIPKNKSKKKKRK